MGHSIRALFASRSRRILVATVVLIALLCTGAYAYWRALPSQVGPSGPSVTLTSFPLQLTMSLDKTQYSFSENMTISFYLRNISNETVTLVRPDQWPAPPGSVITAADGITILPPNLLTGLYHFGLILYSSNGTMIERDVAGPLDAMYDIVLQPNASLNQTVLDNFAGPVQDVNGRITQLEPGAYGISGVLRASLSDYELQTWETPSITFTLVSTT